MRSIIIILLCVLTGCSSVPAYDQVAYDRSTQLKVDAINTMELAVRKPFNVPAVTDLKLKMQYAYEYEKGKGNTNIFTIKQYELMMDPKGALLYGFLARWAVSENGFSPVFVRESSVLVSQGFDEIIKMEWNKK